MCLALLALAVSVSAQSAPPSFQVASIKANNEHPPRRIARPLPAGYTAENASLKMLITNAYSLQSFQLIGGPAWMEADGYDITAKSDTAIDRATALQMLQVLLAERFALKVHRETKELPVYELTIAKGGPKLPPSKEGSCIAAPANGGPMPPPGPGQPPALRCGNALIGFSGTVAGGKLKMADLVRTLANIMGRPVVDHTGFTDEFDLKLSFSPDQATEGMAMPVGMATPPGVAPGSMPPSDSDRPSIFAALQEQLGLKLSSAKGPVEVLVVDHVERPSAN